MSTSFQRAVREVLLQLEPGEVVSYGEAAAQAGYPGAARAVGNILRSSDDLPWWRVVTADGRLVPGIEHAQETRLRAEGVQVTGGRVSRSPSGILGEERPE